LPCGNIRCSDTVLSGWCCLSTKDADIDGGQVCTLQSNASGMQPVCTRFTEKVSTIDIGTKADGDWYSPLNHEVTTVIHRAADTSCTVAGVAVTLCAGGCKIRVRQGRGRSIVAGMDVKITTKAGW
jgi:hypothetical protein